MSLKKILFISLIATFTFSFGCGGTTETPANKATNTTGNGAPVANGGPTNGAINGAVAVAVTTPTPDQITNDAPTLKPVYKAYCAAIVKKDEAAVRKLLSASTITSFEASMKDNEIRTLLEFLSDPMSNENCDVKNEEINGDKAAATVIAEWTAKEGVKMGFVKEDGQWKISNTVPGFNEKAN